MNEIDALLGLGVSEEEKMRLLSNQLRGKKRAADFFALSTVEPIQRAAELQQKNIMDSAQQGGVLRRALQEREHDAEQGRLDRESREREGELDRRNMLERSMNQRRYGKPYSYVQRMRGPDGEMVLMGLNAETGQMEVVPGAESFTPDPMSESQVGSLMERAYARMDPTLETVRAVEELDNLLEKHSGPDADPRNIPGLGFVEKMPVIGGVARLAQDVLSGTGEQGDMYSAVRGVTNIIVRNQAGLTQTNRELQNVKEETGLDPITDPQVFLRNLDRIKNALEQDLARQRNTMAPQIVEQIEREYELTGQQSPFKHRFRRLQFGEVKPGWEGLLSKFINPAGTDTAPDLSKLTDEELQRLMDKSE